jgi:hypothetical protein
VGHRHILEVVEHRRFDASLRKSKLDSQDVILHGTVTQINQDMNQISTTKHTVK